jgi:hypothetical protein
MCLFGHAVAVIFCMVVFWIFLFVVAMTEVPRLDEAKSKARLR